MTLIHPSRNSASIMPDSTVPSRSPKMFITPDLIPASHSTEAFPPVPVTASNSHSPSSSSFFNLPNNSQQILQSQYHSRFPQTSPKRASSPKRSPNNSSTVWEKWLNLLDHKARGYISEEDVLVAIYVIGFEPTRKEMADVVTEVSNKPWPPHYPKLIALFHTYHSSYAEIHTALKWYRANAFPLRKDGFVFLKSKVYFRLRLISLLVPFLSILWIDKFLPNFTTLEKSYHKITRNVIGGFSTLLSCFGLINFGLYFSVSVNAQTLNSSPF
jgi:hypothetical protein